MLNQKNKVIVKSDITLFLSLCIAALYILRKTFNMYNFAVALFCKYWESIVNDICWMVLKKSFMANLSRLFKCDYIT